jgi:peptidoglycan L-alanyl-D-glutamate endopeptidase CwlK
MALNKNSLLKMKGVHPDLIRVIKRASEISKVPFIVVEGLRTAARQRELLAAKATKTLNSRHITGHAVDIVPILDGKPRWDWPLYLQLAAAVREAARVESVPIRWGGTWSALHTIKGAITSAMLSKSFPDGPHFELPRQKPYI